MRAARAFRSSQASQVRFHAELVTSLALQRGIGPASYTRNTSASVLDHDNVLRTALAGEARFSGARRVHNRLTFSEDFSNAAWTKRAGIVLGAKTADGYTPVQFTQNTDAVFQKWLGTVLAGVKTALTVEMYSNDMTQIGFAINGVGNTSNNIATRLNISSTPRRYAIQPATGAADTGLYLVLSTKNITSELGAGQLGTLYVRFPQLEYQTQNPGAYVSTNVLSFPYHGAGVDGVRYFDDTNGNTADANGIVTEAPGLPLAPWYFGRFGKRFITYDPWLASTAYVANQGAIPVRQNGYYYIGTAGTTGAAEPVWPTTIGATVVDGGVTWTCQGHYKLFGYLAEGQRTNSILQSRNFADAAWTNSATAPTATQNAVGIDGQPNTAWTLDVTDGMNQFKTQALTVANDGATHTTSIWVPKTGTATYSGLGFTLTGGTTTLQAQFTFNSLSGFATARAGNAAGATATVELVGGFWWVQVSCANNTTGNVTLTKGIFPCVATSDSGTWAAALTGSVVVDWAQGELNAAFASMPILTTTAAVTRSADNLSYPVVGNLIDPAGTASARYYSSKITKQTDARILGSDTGTLIQLAASGGVASNDNATICSGPAGTSKPQSVCVSMWGAFGRKVYDAGISGAVAAYDGSFNLSKISIGAGTTLPFYGTIRSVKILSRPLTDAEIAEL